ncbi:MAG: methylated-DNA--[protein]-cysteine S-methyltransferase [Ignavibacteriaceae bacterium]|nr:methylated-DNA--[protein]-cysteine S-methyltransferase [Ignavibacteriaceae bacterium]
MSENFYYAIENISKLKIAVVASSEGIEQIHINPKTPYAFKGKATKLQPDDPYLFNVFEQLREYFDGGRKKFDVPLNLKGTEFQKKVWKEVSKIPFGKTKTYKEIALKIGDVKSVRAVGRANGANLIPIIIPCHRVIGANGSLTGYAAGIDVKEKLLALEGVFPLELFE